MYDHGMTIPQRPFFYIAGPITLGNPMHSTKRAIEIADRITSIGGVCHVPHLSILWDTVSPKEWDYWINMDLEIILRADAVFRMEGESRGADIEVDFAIRQGIPVFYEDIANGYGFGGVKELCASYASRSVY